MTTPITGLRVAVTAALLTLPVGLAGQAPSLDRVEDLARLGRTEEAREALTQWWSGARDAAPQRDLQRGLWLRGRLTVDPVQAELDYQRLVVLYPSGPYTAQALFRLAQAAHAQGDGEDARRHVEALARDHPGSPTRAQAEAWLREAGAPPPPSGARPSGTPAAGATVAGNPGRGGGAAPAPGAAQGAAGGAADPALSGIRSSPGRPPAPADVVLDWSVQFGAFSDENRAFALQGELVSAGLAARLVRVAGSGFLHVRIGRFGTRDEAAQQLDLVTSRGFTAAIVRDDRAEEVVRR